MQHQLSTGPTFSCKTLNSQRKSKDRTAEFRGFGIPVPIAYCNMLWREPKPPSMLSSSTDEPPAASPSTTKFTSTSPLKRDGAEGWPRLSVAQSDRDGVDPRSSRRGATGVALKVGKLGDSAGAVVGWRIRAQRSGAEAEEGARRPPPGHGDRGVPREQRPWSP